MDAAIRQETRSTCGWEKNDPLYKDYHNREWGTPVWDDRIQFEFLILEGAQAGLSWLTVLRKRENYRRLFAGFDPRKVARYGKSEIRKLLADPGIIRNRLKVESAVSNAGLFLDIQKEAGTFSKYIWGFVGGKPIVNRWKSIKELPCRSLESDALSADLKKRGFKFTGSTIMYSHMQALGLVNDHIVTCFRHRELISGG